MNEVSVYVFTGFLEAGKTKMIQKALEDPSFNAGEETLLLVCEEGMEEYDPSAFAAPNVRLENVEEESALTPELLAQLRKWNEEARAEGVTLAQYALRWILRRPEVTSVIVGARTVEQLLDSLSAAGA